MEEINMSGIDYPEGAAAVRDLIKSLIEPKVDRDATDMDTGGGFGSADLWATFGGVEYIITVKSPVK